MSELPPSESSRPPRRSRPSYGLPGPEGSAAPLPDAPGPGGGGSHASGTTPPSGYGTPPPGDGGTGQQGYGAPWGSGTQEGQGDGTPPAYGVPPQAGYGTPPPGPQQPWGAPPNPQQPWGAPPNPQQPWGAPQQWGAQPAPAWAGGPVPAPGGAQPRRKGVWQLIVGIVVLVASVVVFLAMVLGATARPLAETLTSAETVESGTSVALQAGEIRMVALASSDIAAGASCSISVPSSQGLAQPVGGAFPVDVAGVPYEAVVQIAAYTPVDVALDCTGTSQPIALTAPMDTTEMAGGLLGAFAVGTVLGLAGLGLILWGIIALVRSGRRIRAWREGRPS
jgi:hypothetical protein